MRALDNCVFLQLAGLLRNAHFFHPDVLGSRTNLQLCRLLLDSGVDGHRLSAPGQDKVHLHRPGGGLPAPSQLRGDRRWKELSGRSEREALVERGVIRMEKSVME